MEPKILTRIMASEPPVKGWVAFVIYTPTSDVVFEFVRFVGSDDSPPGIVNWKLSDGLEKAIKVAAGICCEASEFVAAL